MNLTEFVNKIVSEIKHHLPAEYADATVTIQECPKPGNQFLTGIVIRRPGEMLVPVVYLDEFYQDYSNGHINFPDIYAELTNILCHQNKITVDTKRFLDWNVAKEYIISHLINIANGQNTAYIAERPYTMMDNSNLAIIYDLDFSDDENIRTIPVSYDLMKGWNVSLEDISNAANQNNPRLRPVRIEAIDSVIADLIPGIEVSPHQGLAMYVITNTRRTYGAITVIYDGVDKLLRDFLGDYYLIPSSVHEMIAVSRKNFDIETLCTMIQDVNQTEMRPCDILEDVPYIIANKQLQFADTEKSKQRSIPDCGSIPILV